MTARHIEALALMFKAEGSETVLEAIDDLGQLVASMMFYRSAPEMWDVVIDGCIALGVRDRSNEFDQQNAGVREMLDLIDLALEKGVLGDGSE